MFKSKRGIYQTRRPFPKPLAILLSIPVALIVLEILLRILTAITGFSDELAGYEAERKIVTAYRLKFLNQAQVPYDGLSNRGSLIAQGNELLGYKLAKNQQSDFWRINEQGFRADEPVALQKPPGEIRIFVLGGAAAFGYLSLNNQTTLAGQLEQRLNQQTGKQQPNSEKTPSENEQGDTSASSVPIRQGQYRVINAGVPGYTSGNEAVQLALDILAYKPDLILVLNGYEDLMLPSTQQGADIPGVQTFLQNASTHFSASVTQGWQNWITQSYLLKGVQYWILRPHEAPLKNYANQLSLVADNSVLPPAKHLAGDTEELQRRVGRYRHHLQQMARLTAAANVPLIVAVQPEITGRGQNNPIPDEREILDQLGKSYAQGVEAGFSQLGAVVKDVEREFPKNVTALNLYNFYADFRDPAFQDAVHLSDVANTELANRLSESVSKALQTQTKPQN
ncbi:SGNH/GDSL hydrolase family protein [Microcoleus sp. FACHB-672]|uniref:SGNH/GDSL hydrolase family protein n=1 Tax=Microcoleus sp. FACHB-672 TaxID=2692825 RepID=UPI001689CD98|nr:SGNH/GDSL hydrolase family protein [Microcoleus sp. FACHB-672]MBD2041293.1 SGNH/GDSL hydrolase family protein [Microcoleus sp. FACHB-672]